MSPEVLRMTSLRSIAGLLAAAVALPLLATGCGEEEAPAPPLIRPVRTEPVYATGGGRVRSFSGTARAAVESRLSFKVPGTLERVLVEVGDRVKTGQLIAQLDDESTRLQVQEAEAGLASAEAQAVNAEANYDRVQSLYENRNASKNDLDAARAGAVSVRQNVNSIAKRLELARVTLGYTELRAQLDGSIAAVPVEANENVNAGQPVVLLTSGGRLEVMVAIPEQLIVDVREGDEVTVRFDAIEGRDLSGRVTEVGVVSTGAATTFPVTVRLDHEDEDCRPGMAAEVDFRFGGRGGVERIYVPSVAVSQDRQGDRFVFVVGEDEGGTRRARRRSVVIGALGDEGLMEIRDGLVDGELVVTAGVSRIADGQEVRLLPQ